MVLFRLEGGDEKLQRNKGIEGVRGSERVAGGSKKYGAKLLKKERRSMSRTMRDGRHEDEGDERRKARRDGQKEREERKKRW